MSRLIRIGPEKENLAWYVQSYIVIDYNDCYLLTTR